MDAVYEEVASEREQLDQFVEAGSIRQLTLEGESLTGNVAKLLSLGLGRGEAFSFAAAIEFEAVIAIDDRRAIKRAQPVVAGLTIVTTPDIVISGVRKVRITVAEADLLKEEWAEMHKFHLKFSSFRELI